MQNLAGGVDIFGHSHVEIPVPKLGPIIVVYVSF